MSEQKPVASFSELLTAKGTKYDTIEAYDTIVRLGTLNSADMLEWIEEDKDAEKSKMAGLRILVKALVDAEGNRVPEDKHAEFIAAFRLKDNLDNGRVVRKVLEMNGLRAPEKKDAETPLTVAIKND